MIEQSTHAANTWIDTEKHVLYAGLVRVHVHMSMACTCTYGIRHLYDGAMRAV